MISVVQCIRSTSSVEGGFGAKGNELSTIIINVVHAVAFNTAEEVCQKLAADTFIMSQTALLTLDLITEL